MRHTYQLPILQYVANGFEHTEIFTKNKRQQKKLQINVTENDAPYKFD